MVLEREAFFAVIVALLYVFPMPLNPWSSASNVRRCFAVASLLSEFFLFVVSFVVYVILSAFSLKISSSGLISVSTPFAYTVNVSIFPAVPVILVFLYNMQLSI